LATATPAPTATATSGPHEVQARIEIVWPHDAEGKEAPVREADLANITAYLIVGPPPGGLGSGYAEPPPCDWEPKVWLWAALNAEPASPVALGQKRLITASGRTFPAWDFYNVDVSAAREPANKLTFFVTVEGVLTRFNIWTHAADARTLLPTQDIPTGTVTQRPSALDARIEIVWPHDNLPVTEAKLANITVYLFEQGTKRALSPDLGWLPTVRLHRSLNTETEVPGTDVVGVPRVITAPNGIQFLAWDFNDVDVSAAQDPLNKIYFWVTVDGVPTYSNIWSHGADVRTVFPQPDILNSCR
jgi:hypothetical protein